MSILSLQSIRGRLIFASLLLLPLVCGLLAWSLDKAYSSSLLSGQQRQMMLQAYALIAAAEVEDTALWLPEQMTDDRLNQLSSNTFAMVVSGISAGDEVLWQSLSTTDQLIAPFWQNQAQSAGQPIFSNYSAGSEDYFVLQYLVEWEGASGQLLPFKFIVFENRSGIQKQLFAYRNTLWWWLGGIAFAIVVLQLVILRWGLRPIARLINDLSAVQQGKTEQLEGEYPQELSVMTESINQLIIHQTKQRERYRHTLADLAHSIKNPVAIITSVLAEAKDKSKAQQGWINEIIEQNQRIDQIVSYQLTRAVGGASAPFNKAILVEPIYQKVISALKKVYVDKSMLVTINSDAEAIFRGDEGDLMELLGNLVDNAFKYGEQKIKLSIQGSSTSLRFSIEDDGPGMTTNQKKQLVMRGERADTAMPGQGIGLAVVSDIVESYHGELRLENAALGGLKVLVSFNWKGGALKK